jgi:hypothetical protein
MSKNELFTMILDILVNEYKLNTIKGVNIFEETMNSTDILFDRSGENLTDGEIRKCLFNRYEDYLY